MLVNKLTTFLEEYNQGKCANAYEFFGSFPCEGGAIFRVYAPKAVSVSLSGDFNNWSKSSHPMTFIEGGAWEIFIPDFPEYSTYKYVIHSYDGQDLFKADPYAYHSETRPNTASKFYDIDVYSWNDKSYLSKRSKKKVYNSPLNVYELHFGSWKQKENGDTYNYREMADELIPYILDMGFTHIELMPLTEYPYDGSWGYQCCGYFAATSRYGTPYDLMYFIDACHKAGIGVIMDWVPAHFPKDPHGLVEFDGTRLYESIDAQMAEHPSWGTRIFDYSKGSVRSFLISSAMFWLKKYHIDGLRVDAVASMLYLDYDRDGSYWKPNEFGGNSNLHAVKFLQDLNTACFSFDDSVMMIAEESTSWAGVTKPIYDGGLGFNLKWNMGWMNDSLAYLKTDPIYRVYAHNKLTFSIMYAFNENFMLPISHDEVVHMKGSLYGKILGEREAKLATVRAFRAYMMAHPGKKLYFMGTEFGQETEWDFENSLPWDLLQYPDKKGMLDFNRELNALYKSHKPLWEIDFDEKGFSWIYPDDGNNNTISFLRRDEKGKEIFFICNFSGATLKDYKIGMRTIGNYTVILSTDEERFGGEGRLVEGQSFKATKDPCHGLNYSITMDIPPLSAVYLKRTRSSNPQIKK